MSFKIVVLLITLSILLPKSVEAYNVNVSSDSFEGYQFTTIEMQENEFPFKEKEGIFNVIPTLFGSSDIGDGKVSAQLNARRAEAEDTVPAHFLVLLLKGAESDLPDFDERYQLVIKIDGEELDVSSPFNTKRVRQVDEDIFEAELVLDVEEDILRKVANSRKVRLTLMDRIYTQRRVFRGTLTAENLARFRSFYEHHILKSVSQR